MLKHLLSSTSNTIDKKCLSLHQDSNQCFIDELLHEMDNDDNCNREMVSAFRSQIEDEQYDTDALDDDLENGSE